jgi:hypothetical protein
MDGPVMSDPRKPVSASPAFRPGALPRRGRIAVVKGQDVSRYTDFYHIVLGAPWWAFFLGLAAVFAGVNVVFAFAYVADRGGSSMRDREVFGTRSSSAPRPSARSITA